MGKQDVEDEIDKIKVKIESARKQLVKLANVSKQMGNSIECSD